MPIQEGNIKLLASQVMDDAPEGGGQATGNTIADGSSNSIFPDISELDRAIGRVNLRKTFVSVDTADRDGYYGANVIVADPPDDERVSCTLFTTEDGFDRRTDAQNLLEAYVLAGPLSRMRLYGTQFIGQRAILAYQRPGEPPPEIGAVFAVQQETAGGVVSHAQFVRIADIAIEDRTFTDSDGDFTRTVLTIEITEPLRYTFLGGEPYRSSSVNYAYAQIHDTQVADAARYYSTVPLALAADTGDLSVKAQTIYTQLVPSSTTESPVSMAPVTDATNLIPASDAAITENIHLSLANGVQSSIRLLRGVKPGTLSAGGGALADDGLGNLLGAWVNSAQSATIDYAAGVLTFTPAASVSSTQPFAYVPAVSVSQAAHSNLIEITLSTRGTVYPVTLAPIPAPGTLTIDYMALGKWYRLRDNGQGALQGSDPSIGSGSVNYTNGAVIVTLGALPDVGSAVILTWGSGAHYETATGAKSPSVTKQLANTPVVVDSLVVTWLANGVTKTATANASGVISGDGASGSVDALGAVSVEFTALPDVDTDITFGYDQLVPVTPGDPADVTETVPFAAGKYTLSTPVVPGSLTLTLRAVPQTGSPGKAGLIPLVDDEAGNLAVPDYDCSFGASQRPLKGDVVGTINYATGEVTITDTFSYTQRVSEPVQIPDGGGGFLNIRTTVQWVDRSGNAAIDTATAANAHYVADVDVLPEAKTETVDTGAVPPKLRLTNDFAWPVVPGSVAFTMGGKTYVDRSGSLYCDINPATGAGTLAGAINYTTGEVQIDERAGNTPGAVTVLSCVLTYGEFYVNEMVFRTAGAPVRLSSFYVQGNRPDGTLVSATSDGDGEISGSAVMEGHSNIDYQTGIVVLKFGDSIVSGGDETFPPESCIMPSSLRYNCVVLSTLPLDADILGLDPVRLPPDGRVPVFRPGSVVVVHHTDSTAPATVSNGQTINTGRTRLSRVRVVGDNGTTITTGYSADLDAGTVTFTDVSGYSQPVTVEHRIEDMAMVSDVQISGDMRLLRQLTHDFPLGSYVSSALIIGDMKARVPVLFDQQTWSNTWSNTVSGSSATGTFNDVLAPIVVTNKGAITERWALVFTSTTNFNVIGEHVGQIATGSINADCAPTNPAAGVPYFTVPSLGWGTGWGAGNVLRFNTTGALFPVWVARTIQQGPATAPDDSFSILIRGDIDRP